MGNLSILANPLILTCFNGYSVPQVLRHYNILQYSLPLASNIDHCIEIPSGSEEEVEIRAATIIAVEKLCQAMKLSENGGRDFRVVEVDWILWQLGEKSLKTLLPAHRTLTVFY